VIAARRAACTALLLCAAFSASAQDRAASAALQVSGSVEKSLALSVEDLKRLPAHDVEYRPRDGNGQVGAPRHYTGCLLRDVLDAAKLKEKKPRDFRRSYVLASARDNYEVLFSWAELYIAAAAESVIVAYARDGEPLAESEGPLALVAGGDTRPARHVKWLQAITFGSP
jgi:DMSO/TMAO reductase YedYZ molybdopterin-dependent catalytic subunit